MAAGLAAALTVVLLLWQSVEVSDSYSRLLASPLWALPAAAWAGLFALFGRVVADVRWGEHGRSFPFRPLLRLAVPAWVAVLFAMFVIGPLMTLSSTATYFADPLTWSYLSNLAGWPQLTLPGLFEFANVSRIVNPAVALFLPGLATLAVAGLVPDRASLRLLVPLALASAALVAMAIAPLTETDSGRFALVAAAAGQWGLASARWEPPVRLTGKALLGLLAVGALAAGAGWVRPDAQTWVLPPIALVAATIALLLPRTPVARPLRRWPRLVKSWPALVLSFPLQQAISQSALGTGALAIALYSLPAILAVAWGLSWAMDKARLRDTASAASTPTTEAPLAIGPAHQRSTWRRRDTELSLVVAFIVVAMTAILALIAFAMQRQPWDG